MVKKLAALFELPSCENQHDRVTGRKWLPGLSVLEDPRPESVAFVVAVLALVPMLAAGIYGLLTAGIARAIEAIGVPWEPAMAASALVVLPAIIVSAVLAHKKLWV